MQQTKIRATEWRLMGVPQTIPPHPKYFLPNFLLIRNYWNYNSVTLIFDVVFYCNFLSCFNILTPKLNSRRKCITAEILFINFSMHHKLIIIVLFPEKILNWNLISWNGLKKLPKQSTNWSVKRHQMDLTSCEQSSTSWRFSSFSSDWNLDLNISWTNKLTCFFSVRSSGAIGKMKGAKNSRNQEEISNHSKYQISQESMKENGP